MTTFLKFLSRNSIEKSKPLPLVHTSEAILLKKILRDKVIKTSECNVFKGENLVYTFVGRPAYKKEIELEPEYWEMPICIILEYDTVGAKHVFPFDTGAFKNNKYPNFISIVEMNEYDVVADPEGIPKIIGTFFVDTPRYYKTKIRSPEEFIERYAVDVLDEEIKALHTLIATRMPKSPDDRRASIEVSFARDLSLGARKVLAVVFPETYLESAEIVSYIEEDLGAEPITYPAYANNVSFYFACIYTLVEEFYTRKRLFNV